LIITKINKHKNRKQFEIDLTRGGSTSSSVSAAALPNGFRLRKLFK